MFGQKKLIKLYILKFYIMNKNKRIYLTTLLLAGYFVNTYAYSVQEFATNLKSWNKSYILPILGAGLLIYAIVTGILKSGKIRKGGEEQTDAIINWLSSLVWPVVVIIVAEGIVLGFSAAFQ